MANRFILIFLLLPVFITAQPYPDKPGNYVTDEAGVLSSEQHDLLNAKCRSFEDSSSNQLFVYITKSLNGQEMQPLCQEIFHKWKIGQQGKNNGVLIGIFTDDHKFRIHTGYGLEGVLPDLLTKKIQDKDMKPWFKEGNYYAGIDQGIDKLIYFTKNEYTKDADYQTNEDMTIVWVLLGLVLVNMILFGRLYYVSRRSAKSQFIRNLVVFVGFIFAFFPVVGALLILILFAVLGKAKRKPDEGDYSYAYAGDSSSWSDSDSSSSSDSDFDGGGGGDSGGGGSDSSW
jgi:uncharacterized protein